MEERILNLDDVLEIMIEQGTKPEDLFIEYVNGLHGDAKKAAEFEFGQALIKQQIEDFLLRNQMKETYAKENYFNDNRFVPEYLADDIMKFHTFRTLKDTNEIYIYASGCYWPYGESIIESKVTQALSEKTKKHFAEETKHIIKTKTFIDRNGLPTNLISLRNGLFDLNTGKLLPHSPDFFNTNQLPVNYDNLADCPAIKKFLSEIVKEENIPELQEFIGYCLLKDYPIHKAFLLVGEGSNGKTTFINMLISFLGRLNVSNIMLQDFITNRFAKADLYGKLANMHPDLPDKALYDTGVFKALTGDDFIEADKKFGKLFNFQNYAKMIFACNKVPEVVSDDSDAFFRRWELINFPNQFIGEKCDPNKLAEITTDSELSGLFNFAIEGLKRLLANGSFTNSKSTDEVREQYTRLSSPAKAFLTDMTLFSGDSAIEKEELYKTFIDYCHEKNLATVSKETFGKKIVEFYGSQIHSERILVNTVRKMSWKGIKLLSKNEVDEQKVL